MTIQELIALWKTDEGKPVPGPLIDLAAYEKDPTNIGCMCALGQVLHRVGGRSAAYLGNLGTVDADVEVADLLGISRAHAVLLRLVGDSADGAPASVLESPEAVLGDQWGKLLDFWWHLGTMTVGQSAAAGSAAKAATGSAAWEAAVLAVWDAAKAAAGEAAAEAAGAAVWGTVWGSARASNEIQGASIFAARGTPFFFLPMFGFASPDDIPARPASYGATTP